MDSKQIIIKTAFAHFLDKGYKNTSMSDLVNATNFSKGAFYHHFENKERLYNSVIDAYFLSYYNQIDWDKTAKLTLSEVELLIKSFYTNFVPEIVSTTDIGMSRYFVLFFETYTIYPLFAETVKSFYSQLKNILELKYQENGAENPEIEALRMIAKYEGLIFWLAINPEENTIELINAI